MEVVQGYDDHRFLVIGHLGEAADELVAKYPQVALKIRGHRINYYRNYKSYVIPFMDLFRELLSIESKDDCCDDDKEYVLGVRSSVCSGCEHYDGSKVACAALDNSGDLRQLWTEARSVCPLGKWALINRWSD